MGLQQDILRQSTNYPIQKWPQPTTYKLEQKLSS